MAPDASYCSNCQISSKVIILRRCDRCKSVRYCSKTCQATHWNAGRHREDCSSLRDLSSFTDQCCDGNFCTPEGLVRKKKWWGHPHPPPMDEVTNPGIPPVIGGVYFLKLKNRLYDDRLCVVLGEAPGGRLAVLCRNMTGEDAEDQKTTERPICVLPENLRQPGIIRVDTDWYGYGFARSYPLLYEAAFLQTPRIVTALGEIGLVAGAMRLIPIVPTVGANPGQCHTNVLAARASQQNCTPVFGYSLLPGLSCGCINIEAHSVLMLQPGVFVDITPDTEQLAAKFFMPDPDISFEEFFWLGHIRLLRLLSLNRPIRSLNIAPVVTPTGRSVLRCCDQSCRQCNTAPNEVGKCILPRKLALHVIAYGRDAGFDFAASGFPIQCPPPAVMDSILDPKWETPY